MIKNSLTASEQDNQLLLKSQTKASIIVTFTRFLAISKDSSDDHREEQTHLVEYLKPLLQYQLNDIPKAVELRQSVYDLFFEMHEQGFWQLNEAIKQLITM